MTTIPNPSTEPHETAVQAPVADFGDQPGPPANDAPTLIAQVPARASLKLLLRPWTRLALGLPIILMALAALTVARSQHPRTPHAASANARHSTAPPPPPKPPRRALHSHVPPRRRTPTVCGAHPRTTAAPVHTAVRAPAPQPPPPQQHASPERAGEAQPRGGPFSP
jgi:hypothetical protein